MNLIRKAGFLLVCATMVAAGNGTAQNVQRTSQGIKCATQGMDVNVEFYSPSIVSNHNKWYLGTGDFHKAGNAF